MTRRGLGTPPPYGIFSRFLHDLYREGTCVIVRHKRSAKIFKLFPQQEVHVITARSICEDDRERLIEQGILQRG